MGPSIDRATEVFYEHYHKAHSGETCYQGVRRAMGHVVEYVLQCKAEAKPIGEQPTEQLELDQCQ